MMIVPLILSQGPQWVKPSNAREALAAREFLREAHTGLVLGELLPPYDDQDEPKVSESDLRGSGWHRYWYHYAQIEVESATGRIGFYGGGPAVYRPPYRSDRSVVPRAITDRDAAIIAQRVYSAAGWPGTIAVSRVEDLQGDNDSCVRVFYSPTVGGVPYVQEESMEIERQTGLLETFSWRDDLPTPPTDLTPKGGSADARRAALRAAVAADGTAFVRIRDDAFRLRIWCPSPPRGRAALAELATRVPSSRARDAVRARRGLLAYVGRVNLGPLRYANVAIDAHTGETLGYDLFDLTKYGGVGGALPAPKEEAAVPPATVRPWRLATKEEGWRGWTGPVSAALVPAASPAPATGKSVTLTDGAVAFPATYDARANLLGVAGRAYRPGPALAALLRRRTK